MQYDYKKEDYTTETVDILIKSINDFYKTAFDNQQEKIKQLNYLILSNVNEEYESIFSNYRSQIFEVIFHYSDFSNLKGEEVKNKIHKFRENQFDVMKKYKEDSFDSLFDSFGDNFSVF